MASAGFAFLVVAFAAALASAVLFLAGHLANRDAVRRFGRVGVLVSLVALFACCAVLVVCFMTGDLSIKYVLEERSLSTDGLAWLYKLSGLWAGRSGSLLFWTFLIALFNGIILARGTFEKGKDERVARIDDMAMMVVSVVVAVFSAVLLFSDGNMPFTPTPASYFDANGNLTAAASVYSMNSLLEHWAMAIHPPMLFVGYAGLTVPFGYAMATLIVNDSSKLWVERATRFVLASWLFLGAGIGLGAVWAYVVLGWGGYWGWDPVENASLLSWLICVALVHTFTVYRQRGAFKRWAVMCACLAFTFVIVATFITRSGIVQSVHAFSGDPVSLVLFGGLIIVSIVVPAIAIALRWKLFSADTEGADDIENMLSKDAAYYFNNVVMVLFAFLLTYMTVSSALPRWMPFGGDSLGTTAYEAIARPLGIVYLLILTVCPLLAWGKTYPKKFLRQARIPAVCALVLFAFLAFWWATQFVPVYDAMMAKGNANSQTLLEAGPRWYYNGLALVGLLVASLLFFNALFMFVRNVRTPGKRPAAIGGSFAHVAMAVILIGLIGSSMYVYEQTGYMVTEEEDSGSEVTTIVSAEPYEVQEYRLEYAGDSITDNSAANNTVLYEATFDVYKGDRYIGQVNPSIQLDVMTQQQKLNASVISFPEEDLFVVYRGVNQNGDFSLDVRVNQFIMLVWIGFGMLMVGTLFALVGRRKPKRSAEEIS
ncbi:MAG: cytochrome c biogenesis protein CcsA [Eggerthellaceae bacterium]|nr:cytochrome c biogenesis protein CcsA [Eggerthellaceae bacterium]